MNRNLLINTVVALVFMLAAETSFANDGKANLNFNAKLGYLNDSNVGISDLDANTGTGDAATTYGLALKVSLPVSAMSVARFGYDYDSTSYQNLSRFDLDLHSAFGEIAWRSSYVDAGVRVDSISAQLDGKGYLDLVQVMPSVSRLINSRVFLRGAYTHGTRSYKDLPGRDATNGAFRADLYVLIDNMDRYLALGIQSSREDARDMAFDYKSLRWKMTYGHSIDVAARNLEVKASLGQEVRKYVNEDNMIGDRRRDNRLRMRVGAEWQIFEHASLTAAAEKTDINSNLASADLDKLILRIGVRSRF